MTRNIELDILKGLLIIFVVIGHTDIVIPYRFNMPAFFLISGYLTKNYSFSMNKVFKFFVPYLCYSILFYLIFTPEPLLKNIIRTLYGGRLNTLVYSYPYWFINAFAIVNIIFGIFFDKSLKIGKVLNVNYTTIIFLFSYILIHTHLFRILPYPLPMSIDCALGGYVFYYLGFKLKKVDLINNRKYLTILIIPFAFIILNRFLDLNYRFNMKAMSYHSIWLDLLIPCSFVYLLYIISVLLKKISYISNLLVKVGSSSMTIFYIHAAILYILKNEITTVMNVAITIVIGVVVHKLLTRFEFSRFLFLGQIKKRINPIRI